jgi:hypothetical protein
MVLPFSNDSTCWLVYAAAKNKPGRESGLREPLTLPGDLRDDPFLRLFSE